MSQLLGVGWGAPLPPEDPACLPTHLVQEMKVRGQRGRTGYLLSREEAGSVATGTRSTHPVWASCLACLPGASLTSQSESPLSEAWPLRRPWPEQMTQSDPLAAPSGHPFRSGGHSPAKARASSVGTARRWRRSLLLPTSMMTMLLSAWSRSSFSQRSAFSARQVLGNVIYQQGTHSPR